MEDALKGFMKKLNNPFASSSSSSRFKGEGRRLGHGESRSDDTEKKKQATINQAKVQEEEDERRKIRVFKIEPNLKIFFLLLSKIEQPGNGTNRNVVADDFQ